MPADKSQKTEAPTPRRIKEAREKGQVAKSPDLSAWAGMLGAVVLLQVCVTRGASAMRGVLEDMGLAIAHPSQAGAMKFATDAAWKSAGIVAPMLARHDADRRRRRRSARSGCIRRSRSSSPTSAAST